MASLDGRRARHEPVSVSRAVITFALSGLVVLLLVGVGGVLVLRRISTTEAYREAEKVAAVAARIVQRRLDDGIVTGTADSLLAIDALVNGGVLTDPIVRVKIIDRDGRVLYYSDAPELIGTVRRVDAEELAAIDGTGVVTEQVDLSLPENELERGFGPLLQVSMPVTTPNGTPLLFQASLRFDSVAASGRELWTAFLPVLAVALLALALLQIPLAVRLARRVRDSQRERERLLRRAIEASDLERRRIASDLHDGTVQELAGLSMSLAAEADSVAATDPEAAEALRVGAAKARRGVRSLRSVVMGIDPPNVRRAGLPAALSDLAAPLAGEGIAAEVEVPNGLALSPDAEALVFRAAREALRNVVSHAHATRVGVRVTSDDGHVVLEVEDDGVGFSSVRASEARANGHIGLDLLNDLAHDAGGTVEVSSSPGGGTRVRVEVPAR
ncbi:MAG: sensor histidine kinase [Actinobacteria bacterium]|nr:sensor histidine kinase [Actinomycetota bacterium]